MPKILKPKKIKYKDARERTMAKVRVRDTGRAPICGEGLEIPLWIDGFYEYSVTSRQARYWNSLSEDERNKLIEKSFAEHRDLRDYLGHTKSRIRK